MTFILIGTTAWDSFLAISARKTNMDKSFQYLKTILDKKKVADIERQVSIFLRIKGQYLEMFCFLIRSYSER